MNALTLPTEASVRAAVQAHIDALSYQLDVVTASKNVLSRWVGKCVNKHLAEQLTEAARPACTARGDSHAFASVQKHDHNPTPERMYLLRWHRSWADSQQVTLITCSADLPKRITEQAVEDAYRHGVHPAAMRDQMERLQAYLAHPTWIADQVSLYRECIANLQRITGTTAGPQHVLYARDGTIERKDDGLLYPVSQCFACPPVLDPVRLS